MQDRYVGDVGDFGKFGVLRALTRAMGPTGRLGVVWCAFPDESHNGDGRHVGYLRDPAMARLDGDLHAGLRTIVASGKRAMLAIETAGLFPTSTIFFREPIAGPVAEQGRSPVARRAHRERWLSRALQATAPADLVFLDPDNGIGTIATSRDGQKAGKFVFLDELARFWARGQSLIVYHHTNRTCPVDEQVTALGTRLSTTMEGARPIPLLFRRGSCRIFWVVAQPALQATLAKAAGEFLEHGWADHFGPLGDLQSSTTSAGPVPSQSTRMPRGPSTTSSTNLAANGPGWPARESGST